MGTRPSTGCRTGAGRPPTSSTPSATRGSSPSRSVPAADRAAIVKPAVGDQGIAHRESLTTSGEDLPERRDGIGTVPKATGARNEVGARMRTGSRFDGEPR